MTLTTSSRKNACESPNKAAGKKMVNAIAQAISQAKAKKRAHIEMQRRMVEKNKLGNLCGWLKQAESERGMARPVMRAIGQAEKICGRRLCVSLTHGMILTSKGFRLVALKAPSELGFFVAPGSNVERITSRRVYRRLDAFYPQAEVQRGIKKNLDSSDLKKSLLYLGVDEWSLHRKVLWGIMTGLTLSIGSVLSFPHFFIHRQDYELALQPMLLS